MTPVNLCACLGPIKDEPYCPCSMISMGLKTKQDYELSPEEKQKSDEQWAKFFSSNKRKE